MSIIQGFPEKKIKKKTSSKITQRTLDLIKEIGCSRCNKIKKRKDFYLSYNNPMQPNGCVPYCKECTKQMICDENGNVILTKVKDTLKKIDRPFIYDLWRVSIDTGGDVFGVYMKNIALPHSKRLTWSESIFEPQLNKLNYENINEDSFDSIELTNNDSIGFDIMEKWGYGYSDDEYRAFERKYRLLKNNYPEKTSMHTEVLLKYIRYSVKEELSTALNDVTNAKIWGQLAKDAATAAKINPSQLSASDLQDGLSTFGQLARAVEQAVDIIPILPVFKEKPQDKVDFTLWCYINYIRDFKGLPYCTYEEIYKFYEDRKNDQGKNLDFFTNDFANEVGGDDD